MPLRINRSSHRIITTLSLAVFAALIGTSALAQSPTASYPVFFQPWSAAIDANAGSTIAVAAKAALANPTYPIVVTGSADTVGGESANKDIALTRAQVVADALATDGVPASRIAIVSAGEITAPGSSPGSFAQFSRRVMIQVGN